MQYALLERDYAGFPSIKAVYINKWIDFVFFPNVK